MCHNRDVFVLRQPKTHQVAYIDRAFCNATYTMWNNIPKEMCYNNSVTVVKGKLETYGLV